MSYQVSPVGFVRSCFKEKFAIPRQPQLAPAARGVLELVAREYIALIYTTNPHVIELVKVFIIYAIMWQGGDAIAAPIQGILRGYKDVNATFWCSMLAYWAICLPVGLLLDYKFNNGAFAYWQSLDIGVICSAVVLSLRLILLQRRIKKDEE